MGGRVHDRSRRALPAGALRGSFLVHRVDPLLAFGNAPLIPSLARLDSFDVVHLHYPFIFGSELTLLGRLRANILQISHDRLTSDLPLDRAFVDISLDTRNHEHQQSRLLHRSGPGRRNS